MHADAQPETWDAHRASRLRAIALVAARVGAASSAILTIRAGVRSPERLIVAMITIWVLAPFVALLVADRFSHRWPAITRTTLHALMVVAAVGSVTTYVNDAFRSPATKPAFAYVMVPTLTWVLMAIAGTTAALIARRRSARRGIKSG